MVGDQGPSAGPRSPSGINDYMIECPLVGRSPITLVDIWEAGGRQAVGEGGQTQGGSGYRRTALGRVPPLAGEPRRLRLSVSPARVRTKVRYFPTEEPDYRAHPAGNYVLIATSREDRARHPEHGPPPARLHFLTTRETKQVSPLRATPDRAAGATTITVTEEDA